MSARLREQLIGRIDDSEPATPSRRSIAGLTGRLRERVLGWALNGRPSTGLIEANKQAVRSFFIALSAGQTDRAFVSVADDATWWVAGAEQPSGIKTKQQYMAMLGAIQAEFASPLVFEVRELTAENDRVAAEVAGTADHINGKHYRNYYHFLFTIHDGQIVAVNEYMDTKHVHDLVA